MQIHLYTYIKEKDSFTEYKRRWHDATTVKLRMSLIWSLDSHTAWYRLSISCPPRLPPQADSGAQSHCRHASTSLSPRRPSAAPQARSWIYSLFRVGEKTKHTEKTSCQRDKTSNLHEDFIHSNTYLFPRGRHLSTVSDSTKLHLWRGNHSAAAWGLQPAGLRLTACSTTPERRRRRAAGQCQGQAEFWTRLGNKTQLRPTIRRIFTRTGKTAT